jgi:hypothetical protein
MKPVRGHFRNSLTTSSVSGAVPKSPKQPSERRLDEEAVSRMDDEGGAPDAAVNSPAAAKKAVPGS